ncbi:MAG TPA: DUF1622 domain-containing protein [bacterium]|nr:DUF1622 domain-containing protein [bacterium]
MQILHWIVRIVSLTGAGVITWGVILILYRFFRLEWKRAQGYRIGLRREALRHQLGSYLLLGLEILIAADVIGTILNPALENMALLAGIVAIRTVIGFFLDRELAASHYLDELIAGENDKAPSRTKTKS